MLEAKQQYLHLTQPNSDTRLSSKLRDTERDLREMNKISERHVPFSSFTSSPGDQKQFPKDEDNDGISIKRSDILELSLFDPLKLILNLKEESWYAPKSNLKNHREGGTSNSLEDDDYTSPTVRETSISGTSCTLCDTETVCKTSCGKEDNNFTTSKSLEETKTSGISVGNSITMNSQVESSYYCPIQDILFDDLSLFNTENKQQSEINKLTKMLNEIKKIQRKHDTHFGEGDICGQKFGIYNVAMESRGNEMENSLSVLKHLKEDIDLQRNQQMLTHKSEMIPESLKTEELFRSSEDSKVRETLRKEIRPTILKCLLKDHGDVDNAIELRDTVDIWEIVPSKCNAITCAESLENVRSVPENSSNEKRTITTKKVSSSERCDVKQSEGINETQCFDSLSERSQITDSHSSRSCSKSEETKIRHSKSSQTDSEELAGMLDSRRSLKTEPLQLQEESKSRQGSEKEQSLSSESPMRPLQDFDTESEEWRSTQSSKTQAGSRGGGAQRECVQSASSDTIRDPLPTLDSQSDHSHNSGSRKENDDSLKIAVESLESLRKSQSLSSGSPTLESLGSELESYHSRFCSHTESEETFSTDIVRVHCDSKIVSPSGDVVLCVERDSPTAGQDSPKMCASQNEEHVELSPKDGYIEARDPGTIQSTGVEFQELSKNTCVDEEIRVFIKDCFAPKKPPHISTQKPRLETFDVKENGKEEHLKDVATGSFPKVSKRLEMMLGQPEMPKDTGLKLKTIFERGPKKTLQSEVKPFKDGMFKSLKKDVSHNKHSNAQGTVKSSNMTSNILKHFKQLKPRRDSLSLFAEKSTVSKEEWRQGVTKLSNVNVYNLNYISPTFADIVRSPSYCKVMTGEGKTEVYPQLVRGAGDADAFPVTKPLRKRRDEATPFLFTLPRNLPSDVAGAAPFIGHLRRMMRAIEGAQPPSSSHDGDPRKPSAPPPSLDTPWWRSTPPKLLLHRDQSTNTVSSEERLDVPMPRKDLYVPSTTCGWESKHHHVSWIWRQQQKQMMQRQRRWLSTSQVPSTTSTSSQTLFAARKGSSPPAASRRVLRCCGGGDVRRRTVPPAAALPLPTCTVAACATTCAATCATCAACARCGVGAVAGVGASSEWRRAYVERREKLRREERLWRREEREWLRRMRARQKAVGAAEAAIRAQVVSATGGRSYVVAAAARRLTSEASGPLERSVLPTRLRSLRARPPQRAGSSVSVPCALCRVPCSRRVCGNAASAPALCVTVRPVATAAVGKR